MLLVYTVYCDALVVRCMPYSSKFPWSNIFVIFLDFHDSLSFCDAKVSSLVLKAATRKFLWQNICDFCVIHENHENIRPQKFGAIRYVLYVCTWISKLQIFLLRA